MDILLQKAGLNGLERAIRGVRSLSDLREGFETHAGNRGLAGRAVRPTLEVHKEMKCILCNKPPKWAGHIQVLERGFPVCSTCR